MTFHQTTKRSHGSGAGFTLIELLVVITIISLLVALLLPVFGRARDVARSVQCLSNQRGIGQLGAMYHQDNNDSFPTMLNNNTGSISYPSVFGDFVPRAIRFYITGEVIPITQSAGVWSLDTTGPNIYVGPEIMTCPGVQDRVPTFGTTYGGPWRSHYGFNSDQRGGWTRRPLDPPSDPKKVSNVFRPSTKIYMMDWQDSFINFNRWNRTSTTTAGELPPGGGFWGFNYGAGLLARDWAMDNYMGRHNMSLNILFIDGHAENRTTKSITDLWGYAGYDPLLPVTGLTGTTGLYFRNGNPFAIGGL